MKKRTTRIVLETLAGLFIGLVMLGAVGIYILSRGPVSISALTPMLERALAAEASPYNVEIADTRIVWGGWSRALDVVATDVRVAEPGKTPIAILPELSVGLSLRGLLQRDIRIRSLDVLAPAITILRDPDGGIALSFDRNDATETRDTKTPDPARSSAWVPLPQPDDPNLIPQSLLDVLTRPLTGTGMLGGLRQFRIIDAEIRLIDRSLSETLWLHSANIVIDRSRTGITAELDGALETPTEHTDLFMALTVSRERREIEVDVTFGPLDTDLPIRYLPDLVFYLPDLTFSGQIGAVLNFEGNPESLTVNLESAAGSIDLTASSIGQFPQASIQADFRDFDAAVWLNGLYDADTLVDFMPRIPVTGSARLLLDSHALPVEIDASLTSPLGAVTIQAVQPVSGDGLQGALAFTEIAPDQIGQTAPRLDLLATMTSTVSGSGSFILDGNWHPVSARLDTVMSAGTLPAIEGLLDAPPPITSGQIAARLSSTEPGGSFNVVMEVLTLDFDGPRLSLNATARLDPEGLQTSLNGLLLDMPMNRLPEFWPEAVAPSPREWVTENIPEADVRQANIAADFTLPNLDPDALILESLSGGIEFDNAEVHYLRPLPPAKTVSGLAEFSATDFVIAVHGGRLKDAVLHSGDILISGLDSDLEEISIDLDLESPLPTALALLDTEPRRYIARIGLDAGEITGDARADVRFSFPLLQDLQAEQIVYETDAVLKTLSVPRPELDAIVTGTDLSLTLRPGILSLEGDVRIDGTPARAVWRENFDTDTADDQIRVLSVITRADLVELRRFDLDLTGIAEGPADITVDYATFASGAETIDLSADLTDATLMADPVNWRKEPGTRSNLTLLASIDPTGTIDIRRFELDGGSHHFADLSGRATAGLALIREATINALRFGRTDLAGRLQHTDGSYRIALAGTSLDADPFLSDDDEDVRDEAPPRTEPRMQITGRFNSVYMGTDEAMKGVDLVLDLEGERVDRLSTTGTFGEGKTLDLQFLPTGTGAHSLSITADDTGLALTVADITGRLEGGTLRIDGSRAGPDQPIVGTAVMRDFRLLEAPRLTKLLEALSVTGMLSALSREGLPFNIMRADFSLTPETVSILDATARGSSIGVTLKGDVNRTDDTLALTGDIAISDLFSKTIGQLPLIDLLVGDGLIGVSFRMTGPIDEPDVAVNPLSVIAPGFLRKVFGAGAAGSEPVPGTQDANDQQGN